MDVNCFTPLADFHAFVLLMANTHLSMDWSIQNASAESESQQEPWKTLRGMIVV